MLLINEIKLYLNESEDKLSEIIAKKLGVKVDEIKNLKIKKKSLDARKDPFYSYSCIFDITNEERYENKKNVSKYIKKDLTPKQIKTNEHPIIVGYGPSGIFCAYRLIEAGIIPIVIERGKRIKQREIDVDKYFNEGIFNPKSNVAYGEGGAGTFSDAKLTTRVKDDYIEYITNILIKHGADEKIAYEAHPHIGTDNIRKVITNITDYLISKGAIFHFEEEFKELILENNVVKGIITDKNTYTSSNVILGIGHSAYNTFQSLFKSNVYIEAKDTAIGFRVEHPQELIDKNQYKNIKQEMPPSEYFLTYKDKKGVYSFCMCPGGIVVPSNAEEKTIVTNGMSYSKRNSNIANSAILIQVNKEEYIEHPLGGFDYLKQYESKAYEVSSSYKALAQNIKDYIDNTTSPLISNPSYPLGTINYNFNDFFTKEDNEIFKKALKDFDRKINGFIDKGIMIGPETKSSSPVRIKRNENLESINTKGLYPMGEGAGYGGGIISCSLDGIRIANKIIDKL